MNYYEFNLLITSNLGEDQVKEFNENLIKELKDIKLLGEINSSQKKLSYLIEGENTAWLTYFNANIIGDNKKEILDEIDKILKEKKEILRFLILSKKEIKEKPIKERKKEVEKVNLEKVNEKVEELLKEEEKK